MNNFPHQLPFHFIPNPLPNVPFPVPPMPAAGIAASEPLPQFIGNPAITDSPYAFGSGQPTGPGVPLIAPGGLQMIPGGPQMAPNAQMHQMHNTEPYAAPPAPQMAYSEPYMAPAAPQVAYSEPYMAPAVPQVAYSEPYMAPAAPQMAYSEPYMAPAAPHMAYSEPYAAPVGPQLAYSEPYMAPSESYMAPVAPQMTTHSEPYMTHNGPQHGESYAIPGGPQLAYSEPYASHTAPQMTHGGLNMAHSEPHVAHGGPHMAHGGPHMAHGGPHMAHGGPNMAQKGSEMAPGAYPGAANGPQVPHSAPYVTQGGPPFIPSSQKNTGASLPKLPRLQSGAGQQRNNQHGSGRGWRNNQRAKKRIQAKEIAQIGPPKQKQTTSSMYSSGPLGSSSKEESLMLDDGEQDLHDEVDGSGGYVSTHQSVAMPRTHVGCPADVSTSAIPSVSKKAARFCKRGYRSDAAIQARRAKRQKPSKKQTTDSVILQRYGWCSDEDSGTISPSAELYSPSSTACQMSDNSNLDEDKLLASEDESESQPSYDSRPKSYSSSNTRFVSQYKDVGASGKYYGSTSQVERTAAVTTWATSYATAGNKSYGSTSGIERNVAVTTWSTSYPLNTPKNTFAQEYNKGRSQSHQERPTADNSTVMSSKSSDSRDYHRGRGKLPPAPSPVTSNPTPSNSASRADFQVSRHRGHDSHQRPPRTQTSSLPGLPQRGVASSPIGPAQDLRPSHHPIGPGEPRHSDAMLSQFSNAAGHHLHPEHRLLHEEPSLAGGVLPGPLRPLGVGSSATFRRPDPALLGMRPSLHELAGIADVLPANSVALRDHPLLAEPRMPQPHLPLNALPPKGDLDVHGRLALPYGEPGKLDPNLTGHVDPVLLERVRLDAALLSNERSRQLEEALRFLGPQPKPTQPELLPPTRVGIDPPHSLWPPMPGGIPPAGEPLPFPSPALQPRLGLPEPVVRNEVLLPDRRLGIPPGDPLGREMALKEAAASLVAGHQQIEYEKQLFDATMLQHEERQRLTREQEHEQQVKSFISGEASHLATTAALHRERNHTHISDHARRRSSRSPSFTRSRSRSISRSGSLAFRRSRSFSRSRSRTPLGYHYSQDIGRRSVSPYRGTRGSPFRGISPFTRRQMAREKRSTYDDDLLAFASKDHHTEGDSDGSGYRERSAEYDEPRERHNDSATSSLSTTLSRNTYPVQKSVPRSMSKERTSVQDKDSSRTKRSRDSDRSKSNRRSSRQDTKDSRKESDKRSKERSSSDRRVVLAPSSQKQSTGSRRSPRRHSSPSSRKEKSTEKSGKRLAIGSLSSATSEKKLRSLFSAIGGIETVRISNSRQKALVSFRKHEQALACRRKFHRALVDNSHITVEFD